MQPDYDPAEHYDKVTGAWRLLLGEDLHYGVFETGDEPLPIATAALTQCMVEHAQLEPGCKTLDVGCGTGAPACHLASSFDVNVLGITTSRTRPGRGSRPVGEGHVRGTRRYRQRPCGLELRPRLGT